MTNNKILQFARYFHKYGLSIIPIRTDGSKAPAGDLLPGGKWSLFQEARADLATIKLWFPGNDNEASHGIAVVGGAVSGGLEILDIDSYDLVVPFRERLEELSPGLWDRLVKVRSPRPGLHGYYRLAEGKPRSQKLAARYQENAITGKRETKTMIETKGAGGYVLSPGCPPSCHPEQKRYVLLGGPRFDNIPVLTALEQEAIYTAARSLNEIKAKVQRKRLTLKPVSSKFSEDPWDDFNTRASWGDILKPAGWKYIKEDDSGNLYWRHPTATADYSACVHPDPPSLLRVFSENAGPLESVISSEKVYSKFEAHKLLNFNGNFRDAVHDIKKKGFTGSTLFSFMKPPPKRGKRKKYRNWQT